VDAGEREAVLGPAACAWKYRSDGWGACAGGTLNVVTFAGAERGGWGRSG
jgi:hypothetical protein